MNISVRLFFGYFLVVGLAAWFVLYTFVKESEPSIRQATEESLVDSANLLAEMAAAEMATGRIDDGAFAKAVTAALQRHPGAEIYGIRKDSVDLRIYLTDARGVVIYDSAGQARGEDFSQWKDIARVLRGEYGARQSRSDPNDPRTSVMHVAAPVRRDGQLIGVISLAKPMTSIIPFVERATDRVRASGLTLLLATAAIGLVFTAWLSWSIHRLRDYARAVSEGRKAEPPNGGGRQLSELAQALATMREKLEGKQYVERYVQNLAHEMKSPLTAVIGAAEILEDELPPEERRRFATSIGEQAGRLRDIIDRMLMLARVEQLQAPGAKAPVDLAELLKTAVAHRQLALNTRQLHCVIDAETGITINGDAFLLRQAILNLLDNAIEFSPDGGEIALFLRSTAETAEIRLRDHGAGAPDYALAQLFNRFYSLPRPATGKKSTGLGLALVREVARLHGGEAGFANHPQGGGESTLILARG
ncbi:two-component system sensor histidine kinase CreC [Dechloromonas sp.]|uniref:two-component system sensor histidine kinase CreC n=1 Tax=Dechloromonas sp. TaxID=1917218 RepID=UPI0011FF1789|nr:two-component system sensor histidine kinase CreC [Dechloromonas sp.]MBU3695490.1 two-component system sensor histidine kinase CreC [Dechloromonas sp.]TEX48968.1 MAG: two-component system sensor histidine kinase CreC [Rhodocyclaceae bacterium]